MKKSEVEWKPAEGIEFDPSEFLISKTTLIEYLGEKETVIVPHGVTAICNYAFEENSKVVRVQLPSTVGRIFTRAFNRCTSLREIVFPEGVEEIHSCAFYGCSALCEVVFPSTLKSIGSFAFAGCKSIRELILPEGVKTVDMEAFVSCTALESLRILNYKDIQIHETAFFDCPRLCIYADTEFFDVVNNMPDYRAAFAAGYLKMMWNDVEPSEGQRLYSLYVISNHGEEDVSQKGFGADTLKGAFRRLIMEKGLNNTTDIYMAKSQCFPEDAEVLTTLIEQERRLGVSPWNVDNLLL